MELPVLYVKVYSSKFIVSHLREVYRHFVAVQSSIEKYDCVKTVEFLAWISSLETAYGCDIVKMVAEIRVLEVELTLRLQKAVKWQHYVVSCAHCGREVTVVPTDNGIDAVIVALKTQDCKVTFIPTPVEVNQPRLSILCSVCVGVERCEVVSNG